MNNSYSLIERYYDRLPITKATPIISLGEGNTPLLKLRHIPKQFDLKVDIYVKYEGLNPTGSFKDRGMTVAVSKAVEEGAEAIICASTGNTSASAAAYAARAGIFAFIIIPEGKISQGKLAQAMIEGAQIIQIKGNFDNGMHLVKEISTTVPVTIVNSINPYRLQGQKTAAFEIIESLGQCPDYHYLPVGNAGNITAYWIGYSESAGHRAVDTCTFCQEHCPYIPASPTTSQLPRMVGYQATGAAPFISGSMVDKPNTVATAIQIGHPQSWEQAKAAQKNSGGWFASCTDEEILAAQCLLASKEGIFCEPASAISIAGAIKDIQAGKIPQHSTLVCTLTGHGMKDPDIAIQQSNTEIALIEPNADQIKKIILNGLNN